MRTQIEIEEFRTLLTTARIGLSSPRAHSAMAEFKDGTDADACIKVAVAHEASARNMWIETALDPWCKRHGITRVQGISIAFDDSSFNPENPKKDLVTRDALFGWGGQQNDFALWLMKEINQTAAEQCLSEKKTVATKLDAGQKNMLGLVRKGADDQGWAPVSAQVFPLLEKTMPGALVELEAIGNEGQGRARLTKAGANVMDAMAWL